MTNCKNGSSCDFDSKLHRPVKVGKAALRYAELWQQIELPKLLTEKKPE